MRVGKNIESTFVRLFFFVLVIFSNRLVEAANNYKIVIKLKEVVW